MLVENKRTGSNSRVLWELVDDKFTGELKFQEARELPYRTWATSVNPTNSGAATIYRAKKPEDFLKRYLLSAQPSNSSSLSPGRGRTTVSEEDWLGGPLQTDALIVNSLHNLRIYILYP
jgi:hypothetical protein